MSDQSKPFDPNRSENLNDLLDRASRGMPGWKIVSMEPLTNEENTLEARIRRFIPEDGIGGMPKNDAVIALTILTEFFESKSNKGEVTVGDFLAKRDSSVKKLGAVAKEFLIHKMTDAQEYEKYRNGEISF